MWMADADSVRTVILSVQMIYIPLRMRYFMDFFFPPCNSRFKELRDRGEVKVTTSDGHYLARKRTL